MEIPWADGAVCHAGPGAPFLCGASCDSSVTVEREGVAPYSSCAAGLLLLPSARRLHNPWCARFRRATRSASCLRSTLVLDALQTLAAVPLVVGRAAVPDNPTTARGGGTVRRVAHDLKSPPTPCRRQSWQGQSRWPGPADPDRADGCGHNVVAGAARRSCWYGGAVARMRTSLLVSTKSRWLQC